MAEKQATIRDFSESGKVKMLAWSALQSGDTGAPAPWTEYADRCVQVAGTFGVGGSATIQGSNDAVNWVTLSDPQGNALVFTSPKIEQALELPAYVRPLVAGDGSTSLDISICMRKA